MGMPAQPGQDLFHFRRAALYFRVKSKLGLTAAKAAALGVVMNTDSCLIASHVVRIAHNSRHPSPIVTIHLSRAIPSHLITLPPPHRRVTPVALHQLVRGVETSKYKPQRPSPRWCSSWTGQEAWVNERKLDLLLSTRRKLDLLLSN
jgi:hypothetical protein